MQLNDNLKSQICQHAKAEYPKECCGLIVQNMFDGELDYIQLPNIAHDPYNHFEIDPQDYLRLSELGEITAIVHSHPNGTVELSEFDKIQMGLHDMDWVICGIGKDLLNNDFYFDVQSHKAISHNAPLLGREYVHGWQDCYTLVKDYFKRELNIELPNFERVEDWWEDENAEPLYQNNFAKAGFVVVDDLQTHDVILCRVGRTFHINHALIFLGDYQLKSESTTPTVGGSLIIHHPHSALSRREIFGDSWQKRMALVVRHKDLFK